MIRKACLAMDWPLWPRPNKRNDLLSHCLRNFHYRNENEWIIDCHGMLIGLVNLNRRGEREADPGASAENRKNFEFCICFSLYLCYRVFIPVGRALPDSLPRRE
jgi:hypothetical protein